MGAGVGFGRGRFAGLGVVRPEAVEFFWKFQRGFKALALFRQNMNDNRAVAGLGKFQSADEQRQIVSVNRAEIADTHLLKEHRAAVTAATVRVLRLAGLAQANAG